MVKIYNKLVRDKIPEIIENDGEKPITRILDDEEYKKKLKNKLVEESKEAVFAKNSRELTKEIGDIFEVIEAIEKAFGIERDEVLKMKEERKQKRGGFAKKIFLERAE